MQNRKSGKCSTPPPPPPPPSKCIVFHCLLHQEVSMHVKAAWKHHHQVCLFAGLWAWTSSWSYSALGDCWLGLSSSASWWLKMPTALVWLIQQIRVLRLGIRGPWEQTWLVGIAGGQAIVMRKMTSREGGHAQGREVPSVESQQVHRKKKGRWHLETPRYMSGFFWGGGGAWRKPWSGEIRTKAFFLLLSSECNYWPVGAMLRRMFLILCEWFRISSRKVEFYCCVHRHFWKSSYWDTLDSRKYEVNTIISTSLIAE